MLIGGPMAFLPLPDYLSLVCDQVDGTKQMRIDAGLITAGTTRVLTMADQDISLVPGVTFEAAGAAGTVLATQLQNAGADLGAADVNVVLVNTNGAFVVNLAIDGAFDGGGFTCDPSGGLDTQAAGTLALGSANATKVEVADAGVVTEVQGGLTVQGDVDTVAAGTLTIGAATATKVEIADTGVVTEVQGGLTVEGTIDTLGATGLSVGTSTATSVTIGKGGNTTTINGNVAFGTAPARTVLAQETATVQIPLDSWGGNLGSSIGAGHGSGAASTCALYSGTFGVDTPQIDSGEIKTRGAQTRKIRRQITLPYTYVAGQDITLRVNAGMVTTAADTLCTLDAEVLGQGAPTVDVCATAAQDMNNTVFANKDFTLTGTTLTAGQVIDIRLTIASNDAAGLTDVYAAIRSISLLVPVKG